MIFKTKGLMKKSSLNEMVTISVTPGQKTAKENEKSEVRLSQKSTNIKQKVQIAIEKACRFESERCLHSPFFDLDFFGYFFGQCKKVTAACIRQKARYNAQIFIINALEPM